MEEEDPDSRPQHSLGLRRKIKKKISVCISKPENRDVVAAINIEQCLIISNIHNTHCLYRETGRIRCTTFIIHPLNIRLYAAYVCRHVV